MSMVLAEICSSEPVVNVKTFISTEVQFQVLLLP
jgi:hypothetical protein